MVQRIQIMPKIAVSYIYEGELARQNTAGIFYVCRLNKYSVTPVWKVNASTALVVYDNRSVALFFFATNQTIESVMSYTETTCLVGNNSTQQATDSPRKGLPELTELILEVRFLGQDSPEFKPIFHEMFLAALPGKDDLRTSEEIDNFIWLYRQMNSLFDLLTDLQEFHQQLRIMKETFTDASVKANLIVNN